MLLGKGVTSNELAISCLKKLLNLTFGGQGDCVYMHGKNAKPKPKNNFKYQTYGYTDCRA